MLLLWSELTLQFFTLNLYLTAQYPIACDFKVVLLSYEGDCLVYAEPLQVKVITISFGFLKEEGSSFLFEFGHCFDGEVGVHCEDKSSEKGIDQILVLLLHELVHNSGKSGRRVFDLPHHANELANHDSPV